jgi:alpha-glucosidase
MLLNVICLALPSFTPVTAASPDGRAVIEFVKTDDGTPAFRTLYCGREVVGPSPLGLDLANGVSLGGPCDVIHRVVRPRQSAYTQFPGKRRDVRERGAEAVVELRERTAPHLRWSVHLRAYDDGVAFRFSIPAQAGLDELVIAGERTTVALPANAVGYCLPLNSFTTSYEKRYQRKPVADVPTDGLLGLPFLVEVPGSGWAAITEANLTDFAGLYLARSGSSSFRARLAPLRGDPAVAVRSKPPRVTPWRVVLLGDHPGRFLESDLLLHLNEPCAIAEAWWINPGKTTFPWWNGFFETGVPFEIGLNTATANHYIDFCAEAGIEYHSLDGKGNVAWYGGPILPYKGADPTKGGDGLDLPEVLRYAKAKGVGIRLWMHWKAAQAHMARAFPLYRRWGVEGVMVDFMDRDDQEMVNFQRDLVRLAAENRLTVTFHGVAKPTGLERTWPNLLTHEGVLNLEYNKWDPLGCPPEHEMTLAYARMAAGPLDFHQGSFRGVMPEAFKPRNVAPPVMGTPARTLATYVVYQNHLPMAADSPSAYRGHPALPLLAKIPCTWDDTRFVAGTVGESVAIARRSGDTWYVGAMTDRAGREMKLPLAFLGPGRYRAESYTDATPARTEQRTTAADVLTIKLAPSGGCLIRIAPAAD